MTMEGAERVPDLRRRLPRLCAANTLDGISTGGTAGHSLHMKRSSFKVKFKSEKGDALCRKGWHILDKGISHVYIKLHSPRLNGKVGRSDWIEEEEFYCLFDGVVIDDAHLFNKKLGERENFYNFSRPHAALNGRTPYERFRGKAALSV